MKQRVKELYFTLRHNWIFYLLSVIILSLITIVISSTLALIVQIFNKEQAISDIYEGKSIFQISDTFIESNDFNEFRLSDKNINKIARFYNMLNKSDNIEFVSTFTQPLYIENFKGGKEFYYNEFAENNVYNIKSVQMDLSAYQFYKIALNEGIEPDWINVQAGDDIIPIILGSDYRDIYAVDDELIGLYYNKYITFRVVGFMKENQSIYYQGNTEFYLDSYILVPYPYECSDITLPNSDEMVFKGILYFAMINSNIATSLDEISLKTIIDDISYLTRFYDHILIGHSLFSLRYSQMVSVIIENKNMLIAFMIFAIIFSLVIQFSISLTIIRRRNNFYKLCEEIGDLSLRNEIELILLFPYMVAFIISFLFFKLCAVEFVILSILNSGLTLLLLKFVCNSCIRLSQR